MKRKVILVVLTLAVMAGTVFTATAESRKRVIVQGNNIVTISTNVDESGTFTRERKVTRIPDGAELK